MLVYEPMISQREFFGSRVIADPIVSKNKAMLSLRIESTLTFKTFKIRCTHVTSLEAIHDKSICRKHSVEFFRSQLPPEHAEQISKNLRPLLYEKNTCYG